MKYIFLLIAVIGIAFGMVSCGEEAPKTLYEKMEREALKSGKRYDSLFFDLKLGMSRQDFFIRCSELNKDSVLYMGMGGKPEHHLKDELKHSARMVFYPDFYEEKIWNMPVKFTYDGWAPWNEDFSATNLRERVKNEMMEWYGGNEFIEIPHPTDTVALVKIDGNRRILLERESVGTYVTATFTDLTVEQELKKLEEKRKEEEALGSESD
jgi:hypothetical protein